MGAIKVALDEHFKLKLEPSCSIENLIHRLPYRLVHRLLYCIIVLICHKCLLSLDCLIEPETGRALIHVNTTRIFQARDLGP